MPIIVPLSFSASVGCHLPFALSVPIVAESRSKRISRNKPEHFAACRMPILGLTCLNSRRQVDKKLVPFHYCNRHSGIAHTQESPARIVQARNDSLRNNCNTPPAHVAQTPTMCQ